MKILNQAALACALTAVFAPFFGSPALADTMTPHGSAMHGSMAADCSKADAMMAPHDAMSGHAMGAAMKPSGDVDKDFASAMSAHGSGMLAMAKMEAKCGKNPGEMKAAADLVNALEALDKELDLIRHTP